MKKITLFTLCIILIFIYVGCNLSKANTVSDNPQSTISDTGTNIKPLNSKTVYANYAKQEDLIYSRCLNRKAMTQSAVEHFPIFKFDTKQELEQFIQDFETVFTMKSGYDEVPSFLDSIAEYDDDFFSEYTLLLAYVPTNSGSFRFGLKNITCNNGTLCMNVIKSRNPQSQTDDMSGWFVISEMKDTDMQKCTNFDAQLIE